MERIMLFLKGTTEMAINTDMGHFLNSLILPLTTTITFTFRSYLSDLLFYSYSRLCQVPQEKTFGAMRTGSYETDAVPVARSTVPKHRNKL